MAKVLNCHESVRAICHHTDRPDWGGGGLAGLGCRGAVSRHSAFDPISAIHWIDRATTNLILGTGLNMSRVSGFLQHWSPEPTQ
jgi:hypothetical protein